MSIVCFAASFRCARAILVVIVVNHTRSIQQKLNEKEFTTL